jgi:hypothetical protein
MPLSFSRGWIQELCGFTCIIYVIMGYFPRNLFPAKFLMGGSGNSACKIATLMAEKYA